MEIALAENLTGWSDRERRHALLAFPRPRCQRSIRLSHGVWLPYEIDRQSGGPRAVRRRGAGRIVDRDVPRPARHPLTRRRAPAAGITAAARRVLSHEDARAV